MHVAKWIILKCTIQWHLVSTILYKHPLCVLSHFRHVWFLTTLWTVACQAPPSMGFSRQEYWSGLPCPPPGHLPNPGTEPTSFMSPELANRFFTTSTTREAQHPLYLVPNIIITPKGDPVSLNNHPLALPPPRPWQPTLSFLSLWIYLLWSISYKSIPIIGGFRCLTSFT